MAVWLTGEQQPVSLLSISSPWRLLTAGLVGAMVAAALATAVVAVIAVMPPGMTGFALHGVIHLGVVLISLWLVAHRRAHRA